MCQKEKARKSKMNVEIESLDLQHLLSQNSLADCFTKRKTNNIFTKMRRMTTAESTRAAGPLQQYTCMAYVAHPHNPPIIEYMHPKC